jgi:hypothetical protein
MPLTDIACSSNSLPNSVRWDPSFEAMIHFMRADIQPPCSRCLGA